MQRKGSDSLFCFLTRAQTLNLKCRPLPQGLNTGNTILTVKKLFKVMDYAS